MGNACCCGPDRNTELSQKRRNKKAINSMVSNIPLKQKQSDDINTMGYKNKKEDKHKEWDK